MLNGDDLGIWFETSNDIIRVNAVKNLIFRAFLPCSSFELARRADSDYLSRSVIFGFYKKMAENDQTRYIFGISSSSLF